MRKIIYIIPIVILGACSRVGSDPWTQVNYTREACGTKDAILTTTGCITDPADPTAPVAQASPGTATVNNATDVGMESNHTVMDEKSGENHK